MLLSKVAVLGEVHDLLVKVMDYKILTTKGLREEYAKHYPTTKYPEVGKLSRDYLLHYLTLAAICDLTKSLDQMESV